METSSPKRRKLSPTASVAFNASTQDKILDIDAPLIKPRRASFLSPTKASLSRFNPSLLPRPKSAGEAAKRPPRADPVVYNRHQAVEDGPASPTRLNPVALRSTAIATSPGKEVARVPASTTSPRRHVPLSSGGVEVAPKRKSKTPDSASSPVRALPLSTTSVIPASPPRPEQEYEGESQNIVNEQLELEPQANAGYISQRKTGSEARHRRSGHVEDGEPELPLTPTQLGLEPAREPPQGLLYSSSPSRRAGRKKNSSTKSSPLKPQDLPPDKSDLSRLAAPHSSTEGPAGLEDEDGTQPEDPDVLMKKKLLGELQNQLKELQTDLTQLEGEVNPAGTSSQEEVHKFLSIIMSPNPTHAPVPHGEKPPSIASQLSLFLPFSKLVVPPSRTSPTPTSPMPSHLPLQLEDPLPYLRIFTSLTVSMVDTLVPSSESDQPLLQHRVITLSSPYNLFQIKLRMSTDPTDESVHSISVTTISRWAASELGSWIEEQAAIGDISSIGWACGRYWEVAETRARCWEQCHRRFHHLISSKVEGIEEAETRDTNGYNSERIDRRKEDNIPNVEQTSDVESDSDHEQTNTLGSHTALCLHLGEQCLLFSQGGVSLLVTWRTGFDWTGEVESHITACASFPKAWRNIDERASLEQVGDIFDRLLRQRGVFEAVRIVVALLFI